MKAFVFPGQGSQYVGMGKELNAQSNLAGLLFRQANEVLGFDITSIMFAGTDEQLKETKVTQPAVFLDSVIAASCLDEDFKTLIKLVLWHRWDVFTEVYCIRLIREQWHL